MRHRTKVAVALCAAIVVSTTWWLVRAPAIEHEAVMPPPDIDIDPPAMRARREAALALAMMPDDPWTFAESLAPSAPAKLAEKERCGQDDAPRFRDGDEANGDVGMLQTKASSPRFAAAQSRIDAALRSSTDPLDRAVADLLNLGDMRTPTGRNDALVQQAIVTTDPRIYGLALGLCGSVGAWTDSCRLLNAAGWARVDAGNGTPWIQVLQQAQARGDAAGERDAMTHLASSNRFDGYGGTAVGAVASHVPQDSQDLTAAHDLMFRTLSLTAVMPMPPYGALTQACRNRAEGDEALLQQCRTISDVMFEHSDSMMARAIGGAVLAVATGDTTRSELVRAERAVFAAHWSPATGFSECQVLRDSIRKAIRTAQIGEVEARREQARQFVTP